MDSERNITVLRIGETGAEGQIMKIKYVMWFFVSVVSAMTMSCDFIKKEIGPPLPKKAAAEYLLSAGVSTNTMDHIINLGNMSEAELDQYSRSDNPSVRHLIAMNPNSSHEVMMRLAADDNIFVRQGVSRNLAITDDIVAALARDPSLEVRGALMGNGHVAESIILKSYATDKKVLLVEYAINPNCPEPIRRDIWRSRDDLAKRWLRINKYGEGQ